MADPVETQFRNVILTGGLAGVSIASMAALYRFLSEKARYKSLQSYKGNRLLKNVQSTTINVVDKTKKNEEDKKEKTTVPDRVGDIISSLKAKLGVTQTKEAGFGDDVSEHFLNIMRGGGHLIGAAAKGISSQFNINKSKAVLNPTNPYFLYALMAGAGSGYLASKLTQKVLFPDKTRAERRLEKMKAEFRKALLEKQSSIEDYTDVCSAVINSMADKMEKQAGGGLQMAGNLLGLLALISGTLAYVHEKKRRRQRLEDAWQQMTSVKTPKFRGLLAAAVNLPSDAVAVDSLSVPKEKEEEEEKEV